MTAKARQSDFWDEWIPPAVRDTFLRDAKNLVEGIDDDWKRVVRGTLAPKSSDALEGGPLLEGTSNGRGTTIKGAKNECHSAAAESPMVLAITTTRVLEILGDNHIAVVTKADARDWCKNHEIRSYMRGEWKSRTGFDPPSARGNVRFYSASEIVLAISEDKARSESAEEALAGRDAAQREIRESKRPDQY